MFIEIQIRSKDMHFISEFGIAAHWHYKNSNNEQNATASNWLGSLLDIQEASGTSVDFIEDTKNDYIPLKSLFLLQMVTLFNCHSTRLH